MILYDFFQYISVYLHYTMCTYNLTSLYILQSYHYYYLEDNNYYLEDNYQICFSCLPQFTKFIAALPSLYKVAIPKEPAIVSV